MTITVSTLTSTQFNRLLNALVMSFENNILLHRESGWASQAQPRNGSEDHLEIGYGHDLYVELFTKGANGQYVAKTGTALTAAISSIIADFEAVKGTAFSAADRVNITNTLTNYTTATNGTLKSRTDTAALNLSGYFTLTETAGADHAFDAGNEAYKLLKRDLDEEKTRLVNVLTAGGVTWAVNNGELVLCKETAALLSYAFNAGSGKINGSFLQALAAGDRTKAWFEFAFYHLGPEADWGNATFGGLAKRRFIESTMFGAFNDPENVSLAEAKSAFQLLFEDPYGAATSGNNRERVLRYEAAFGNQIANANNDLGNAGAGLAPGGNNTATAGLSIQVSNFNTVYQSALRPLLTEYGPRIFGQWVTEASFNFVPLNVMVMPENDAGIESAWNYIQGANTNSDNLIVGNDRANTIHAYTSDVSEIGNDIVWGLGGDDDISGGGGIDVIVGGADNDIVNGNDGDDVLFGDEVDGSGTGNDELNGDLGNDTLYGGGGIDTMYGGVGGDTLYGGNGNDLLFAGEQTAGQTADNESCAINWLYGEQGDDSYYYNNGDGQVNIYDADGSGRIFINGSALGTLRQLAENCQVYECLGTMDENGKPYRASYEASTGTLTIQIGNGDSIVIHTRDPNAPAVSNSLTLDPLGLFDNNFSVNAFNTELNALAANSFPNIGLGITFENAPTLDNPTATTQQYYNLMLSYGSSYIRDVNLNGISYHYNDTAWVLTRTYYTGETSTVTITDVIGASGLGAHTLINDNAWGAELRGNNGDSVLRGGDYSDVLCGDISAIPADDWVGPGVDRLSRYLNREGDDHLYGGGGTDWLHGLNGNDVLDGGDGDDLLTDDSMGYLLEFVPDPNNTWQPVSFSDDMLNSAQAGFSNDVMFGGNGNDRIEASRGNDVIDGGAGNDTLYGGAHNDTIMGGTGNDQLFGDVFWRLHLTTLEQYVYGSGGQIFAHNEETAAGDDYLDGGDGDDIIYAGGGNDVLLGGTGNDDLRGDGRVQGQVVTNGTAHDGNDYLDGGEGNDKLYGEGGNDALYGGAGDDLLWGDRGDLPNSDGNDSLHGGDGNDQLVGDGGNDELFGDEGADNLFGDNGDDVLHGGAGADHLNGGNGNDILYADDNVGALAEYLNGDDGNDVLYGGTNRDRLDGGNGDDILSGGQGDDTLVGGAGNDTYLINAGEGYDIIDDAQGHNHVQLNGFNAATLQVQIGGVVVIHDGTGNAVQLDASSFAASSFSVGGMEISAVQLLARVTPPNNLTDQTLHLNSDVNPNQIQLRADGNNLQLVFTPTAFDAQTNNNELFNAFSIKLGDEGLSEAGASSATTSNWIDVQALINQGVPCVLQTDANGNSVLTLVNYYNVPNANNYLTGLSNGTQSLNIVTSAQQLPRNWEGTNAGEQITTSTQNDVITAQGGDDFIQSGDGNDAINAGTGDDIINGGNGDDSYTINRGDGRDVIIDAQGTDTLIFGAGITASNIEVHETNAGLQIILTRDAEGNVVDEVLISNWLRGASNQIEQFQFSDSSVLTSAQIEALVTGNHAPDALASGSALFEYGQTFSYIIPSTLFSDVDGDTLTYVVRQADGSALPEWMQFDASSNTLSGVFSLTLAQQLALTVYAIDSAGLYRSTDVVMSMNSIVGTAGNDTINGSANDDTIFGLAGDDRIFGGAGNDVLSGGAGNDILYGESGNDTYRYQRGDGEIIVTDSGLNGEQNTVQFGDGILPDDIDVSFIQGNLFLIMRDGSGFVRVTDYSLNVSAQNPVQGVTFANGVQWDSAEIARQLLLGTQAIDYLTGDDNANIISGDAGNDNLHGMGGNDTITGGSGQDRLDGGDGDDIYRYRLNDGTDSIHGIGNGLDTLSLEGGINQDIIRLQRTDNSLDIFFVTTNEFVRLTDFFLASAQAQANFTVRFSDGSALSGTELNARFVTGTASADILNGTDASESLIGLGGNDSLNGVAGNDYLQGGDGNDTLLGGTGIDVLEGGNGVDTYIFNRGDGTDTIIASGQMNQDTLRFGPTISPSDIVLRVQNGQFTVSISGSSDSIILPLNFLATIQFDDGSSWNSAEISRRTDIYLSEQNDLVSGDSNDNRYFGLGGDDTLYGQAGNDYLDGGTGNDNLHGGVGNNIIYGGEGNDTITSDGGVIRGGIGNDLILSATETVIEFASGDGVDVIQNTYHSSIRFTDSLASAVTFTIENDDLVATLSSGDSIRLLSGLSGYDPQSLPISHFEFSDGSQMSIERALGYALGATEQADILNGTLGYDLLFGLNGHDQLSSGESDDRIYAGDGDDSLQGGAGNDNLFGENGADTLIGGEGIDQLDGGAGNDVIVLGSDRDFVITSALSDLDTVTGFNGNNGDFYFECLSSDITLRREGSDLIVLISGSNASLTINDYFLVESMTGDTQILRFTDGQTLNHAFILANANPATDGDDLITGTDANDNIDALAGNDVVYGLAGADELNGGLGNDTLDGGSGNDVLRGGAGNDIINGGAGADAIDGGAGNDQLIGGTYTDTFSFGVGDGNDVITDFENTYGGTLDNLQINATQTQVKLTRVNNNLIVTISATGEQLTVTNYFTVDDPSPDYNGEMAAVWFNDDTSLEYNDVLAMVRTATTGNDFLVGTSANDTINANNGDDTVYGRTGDDNLSGGNGNDALHGESGLDTLYGNLGNDTLYGGVGNDKLYGDGTATTSSDGADTIYGEAGADTIYAGRGDDVVDGGDDNDIIYGAVSNSDTAVSGIDTLRGGNGDDQIFGNDGNDLLFGDAGVDTIKGGSGNDQITGGVGNDTLTGGAGNDTWFFGRGDGQDTLIATDSSTSRTDRIQLASGIATNQIRLSRSGNNLLIQIIGSTDQISVKDYYSATTNRITDIRFDNGTIWNQTQIQNIINAGGTASLMAFNDSLELSSDTFHNGRFDRDLWLLTDAMASFGSKESEAIGIRNPDETDRHAHVGVAPIHGFDSRLLM